MLHHVSLKNALCMAQAVWIALPKVQHSGQLTLLSKYTN